MKSDTTQGAVMQATAYTAIYEAIGRLAGVCDYANSEDGVGFNGTDAWLGHALAATQITDWDDAMALTAWAMIRKYRKQLKTNHNIDWDALPVPPGAEDDDGLSAGFRERARLRVANLRDAARRKSLSWVRCDGEDQQVEISFPYNPAMVGQIRDIPGRRYQGATKTNAFPFTSLAKVIEFADQYDIPVTGEVRALVDIAAAKLAHLAANPAETAPNVYLDDQGKLCVAADYDPHLNAAMKDLNGGYSTWNKTRHIHMPPMNDPYRLRKVIEEFELTMTEEAREAIENVAVQQDTNRYFSSQATIVIPMPPIPGLATDIAIMPQQWPAIWWATTHKRVILGDNMGWGKTAQSLAAVAIKAAYPAVVVCRPSLILNWVEEIERFFPFLNVWVAESQTATMPPPDTDIVIIGTAVLGHVDKGRSKGAHKVFPWVNMLTHIAFKAVIIDEGQDGKEASANRSQAMELLAAPVIELDGLVLNLTGTAILNRPKELCQQLVIMGLIHLFGGESRFKWRYCDPQVNEWGATYNGASNQEELHDRLCAWGIMVRRSDDSLLGLPPIHERVIELSPSDLDPAVMAEYCAAEEDVIRYLADQAEKIAKKLGCDPGDARVRAAMKAQSAEHLVKLNVLRKLVGAAKRRYITDWIRSQVVDGNKVMVAAHHREEVTAYAKVFGGLKIQGGQTAAAKQADKARFQSDPTAMVIAVAIEAGGVGHTLTAAHIGIQAEWPWGPGSKNQMKKRIHRIGQMRECFYYLTLAKGTIDQYMADMVSGKQSILDAVLDGKLSAEVDDSSAVADVAWAFAQRGFGGRA